MRSARSENTIKPDSLATVITAQAVAGGSAWFYLFAVVFNEGDAFDVVAPPLVVGVAGSFAMSFVGTAVILKNPWLSSLFFSAMYILWGLDAAASGVGINASLFWLGIASAVYCSGVAGGYIGRLVYRHKQHSK